MFSDDLLNWYDLNRRSMPWRGERDPYRIWLSEIMLQQTQVETVKDYYARFLARFPTVAALAEAGEDEVLKLWEGLGYYSRARNLHAAAKAVAAAGGVFPGNAAGLKILPGVGPYAANAIASIAYDEVAPALDGNQARVLSRVLAWEPPLKTPFDLLTSALELISRDRPGDYNQALMDLGAMICLPKQPRCGLCPVSGWCKARHADAAEAYPRKGAPAAKKQQDWTILVLCANGLPLVRRRPAGLLGGLYEFVAVEGHPGRDTLPGMLAERGFTGVRDLAPLPDAKHVFTHLVWRMRGWRGVCDAFPVDYFPAPDIDALAFPKALKVYRDEVE